MLHVSLMLLRLTSPQKNDLIKSNFMINSHMGSLSDCLLLCSAQLSTEGMNFGRHGLSRYAMISDAEIHPNRFYHSWQVTYHKKICWNDRALWDFTQDCQTERFGAKSAPITLLSVADFQRKQKSSSVAAEWRLEMGTILHVNYVCDWLQLAGREEDGSTKISLTHEHISKLHLLCIYCTPKPLRSLPGLFPSIKHPCPLSHQQKCAHSVPPRQYNHKDTFAAQESCLNLHA